MATLADMLTNGNALTSPDASVASAAPNYIPTDAIAHQYRLADLLRSKTPATSWAGVIANGLGAVGGNLVQGNADDALASNQAVHKADIANVANAKDLPTLSKAMLNAQDPTVQDLGLKTRIAQISDDPMKDYNTRAAVIAKYNIDPNSQRGQTFLLTGKLPDIDSPMNVKEWNYFKQLPEDQKQQYLTMKRANQFLDAGTNYNRPNPLDAAAPPLQVIPKNVAGEAAARKTGELNAEGANSLPKTKLALEAYEANNNNVSSRIDKAINQSGAWTTGFMGSVGSHIPGSAANDLRGTLETISANLGFDKLAEIRAQSPTGGALGAVSDQEGAQLRSAVANIEQSQTQEQLVENLRSIQAIRQDFAKRKREAYDIDVARFGAANVPNPDTGKLPSAGSGSAVNPSPGKKYIWSPNGGLQEQ